MGVKVGEDGGGKSVLAKKLGRVRLIKKKEVCVRRARTIPASMPGTSGE